MITSHPQLRVKMATRNFSFTQNSKFLSISLLSALLMVGCQSMHRTTTSPARNQETQEAPLPPPQYEDEQPAPPVTTTEVPRIGLVLGPGAIRSYAHVGVIEELSKLRAPIVAVTGIEMGALVGAIYSNKGQPFDVEWQMMKVKSDDLDRGSLSNFMGTVFAGNRVESGKVPFACPALNMQKQQVFMMNRGSYAQMLPYCLSFPPWFKPYQNNVAGVLDLKSAVDYVRSKGATLVVYVNLLEGPIKVGKGDSQTQTLWNLIGHSLDRQKKAADWVIDVPLRDIELNDFKHRRDVLQRGRRAGQQAAAQISQRFGL
jgi:NTE family protein